MSETLATAWGEEDFAGQALAASIGSTSSAGPSPWHVPTRKLTCVYCTRRSSRLRAATNRLGRVANILAKAVLVNSLPEDLAQARLSPSTARASCSHTMSTRSRSRTTTFCNRVCWFCPNSFIDRRSRLRLMSAPVFHRIIADLRVDRLRWCVDMVTLSRGDGGRLHLRTRALLRAALPKASLVMVSNSDYLKARKPERARACRGRPAHARPLSARWQRTRPDAVAAGLRKFRRRTGHELQANGAVQLSRAGACA